RRQGAARALADPHRCLTGAAGPGRRRGAGDAVDRSLRVAPVVFHQARLAHPAHGRTRRRRSAPRTLAIRGVPPPRQPHAGAPGDRARRPGRTPGMSQAGAAQGRRRKADDSGADRDAVRSRSGQPARPHEHGRRAARIRRRARGPADRREAVPGDMRRPASCRCQGRSRATAMNLLPVEPAWRLADRAEDQRWLVTGLWSEQAVGIIGGEPKCCKSFLALDLAVAVAAGVPCLRRFAVPRAGRVLLYAAEDALHIVRRRLDGICAAAGLGLADLDVQVITAPTVRLDLEADRKSLDATVAKWRPRLLVLDPFVRLHRIDENASGEVAPLLAYLRELQRRHAIAVIVVHHAKKGAGHVRAGQALRGSSEFHAWGDSNLYLRRNRDLRESGDITLTVEHRAAPAMPSVTLELAQRANALALEVVERRMPQTPAPSSVDERITAASGPPPSTSASLPSSPPADSASPTKVIASPVADSARTTIKPGTQPQSAARHRAGCPLPLPALSTAWRKR